MDKPLEITFRNLDRSDGVVAAIEKKYAGLERFCHPIVGMHVKIEMPHKHHRHGNHYQITIEVTVPDQRLVVSHLSDRRVRHETPLPTINDACDAIAPKLEDYARTRRGDRKRHETQLEGRARIQLR